MIVNDIDLKMLNNAMNNGHLGEGFNFEGKVRFCFILFKAYCSSSNFQHVLKIHNLPTRIIPDF